MTPAHAELSPIAWAFPGMGVAPSGAEAAFLARHRTVAEPMLRAAGVVAGRDLVALASAGSIAAEDDLTQQLYTYALSCAVSAILHDAGIAPTVMAGYSFGTYAALHACGALSFDDGLSVVTTAHRIVSRVSRGTDAGMAVVLGLSHDEVRSLIAGRADPSVRIVNCNNATCAIVAGPRRLLAEVSGAALARGAIKAEMLALGIPYHHPEFLAGAEEEFAAFLRALHWHAPRCPIVSSIDQHAMRDAGELLAFAAANLVTPIRWDLVVVSLHSMGIRTVVECGPGISLTQNARFSDVDLQFVNIKTLERKLSV